MHTEGVTLLGLGPGEAALLTRQAWEVLSAAPRLTLRTRQHPAVAGLPAGLELHSFDSLYDAADGFPQVYAQIVERVLAMARQPGGVIYAVPGHPFVAEATCPEIYRRARAEGLPVRVIEGLSFIEPLFSALGMDPFPHTALVDALELAALHTPPFPPSAAAVIAQIHSRAVASEVKLTLMAVYPDEHPVRLVHAAGAAQTVVEDLKLFEIDRSEHTGLLTSLYLPPLNPATSFEAFQEVIAALRAPDGCPWDIEQTHESLRPYLLEEAYEVLAALDAGDPQAMREEFGDLLLQVVLHAQIAAEHGEYSMADVLEGINTKIVRRHPHVFGELQLKEVGGVLQNWERLKAAERAANGKAKDGALDGVALALPALVQAQEYQKRADRIGYRSVEQPDLAAWESAAELGDLLFAIVNQARQRGIDAESALREANARFRTGFNQSWG
ncbi:MAG: MazG family protein [Chloroflexi bacterium]|nr:MazG family protein [Chloroflexota bacterium]